jgi:flagellar protein FliS
MLYDGAIRFGRQAREAMLKCDWETCCEKLIRAQKIIAEMQNGLRPEANASLCEQLSALYAFVFRRMVDANITHEVSALDEALQILEHQRETWQLLLQKTKAAAVGQPDHVADQADVLSVHG